ncbi:MAG TPA: acyl-CoA dehydrogenase family protein [Acidimicrobiia bacterium]|nr:acyl-CoA dehydrogenase family protein [Acidimicrobiia bacterium]
MWVPELRLTPELAAFRDTVRVFLRRELAAGHTAGHRDPLDLTGWDQQFERAFLRRAGDAGLLGVSLPTEYGGGGRPRSWQAVVSFEAAYHDAPLIDTAAALVAPTVLAFGSEAQRDAFVPAAVAGTVNVCIAYTEAGAGSDLSSIATTARPDGPGSRPGWVLDGEKVLVTGAHKADVCATIARTDPESTGRRGLSMFLLARSTPGVTVERVPTANRWTLATVRFDGARVPPDALLGTPGDGWRQMTAALLGERSGTAWLGWATRNVEALLAHCAGTRDRRVADALADLVARLFAALRLAERVLEHQDAGRAPLVEAAMSKVAATELLARVARVGSTLLGPSVLTAPGWFGDPLPAWFAYEQVERLHPRLSVGANEVQRTTIGQAGLGLPAEP